MARVKLDIPEGVTCVSPTQIATAEECWRKWAFTYIRHQREPSGRGAEFGSVVHERHEAYLEHGTAPNPAETWTFRNHLLAAIEAGGGVSDEALSALAVITRTPKAQLDKTMYPGKVMLNMMPKGVYPAPRTGQVEHHFVYKREPFIWYQGLVDWHVYDSRTGRLKVIDHKTSSDPQKYGLVTEAPDPDDPEPRGQLRNAKQAVIYARALIDKYMGVDATPEHVDMYWNYGKSDGVRKHSYVAEAHYDNPVELCAQFEREVHPWAVEIHRLKTMGADPLTLDPNPNSCWLYNQACSHVSECKLSTEDRLGALMSEDGNSLLKGLLNSTGGAPPNAGATPPAAAAPTPPPVATGDAVNPPESAGAVATTPVAAVTAPPVTAPPVTAPPPATAPPAAAPPAAAPPAAPPATAPPATAPPATAPPATAPPAPVAGQPQLTIPPDFWNVVAQNVVSGILAALKTGLNLK